MDILSQFKSTRKIGFNGLYMMPIPLRDRHSQGAQVLLYVVGFLKITKGQEIDGPEHKTL
jgi:hypothetical protein